MSEKRWWNCWLNADEALRWEAGREAAPTTVLTLEAIGAAQGFAEQVFRDNFLGIAEDSHWPLDESLCLAVHVQDTAGGPITVFDVTVDIEVRSRAIALRPPASAADRVPNAT